MRSGRRDWRSASGEDNEDVPILLSRIFEPRGPGANRPWCPTAPGRASQYPGVSRSWTVRSAGRGGAGGADDARLVAEGGGHHGGVEVDVRKELVGLLAHSPADHDQRGREQHLDVPEIFLHPP